MSQMRVDFSVPQTLLDKLPRGGIREESTESGESMLFLNYMANQYHVTQKQDGGGTTDSTYLNLNGGLNLGLWRYRQQSALNYDSDLGSHWTTTRRYVQRAIVPLRSEMMIGEGYTDGRFFPGSAFAACSSPPIPECVRNLSAATRQWCVGLREPTPK